MTKNTELTRSRKVTKQTETIQEKVKSNFQSYHIILFEMSSFQQKMMIYKEKNNSQGYKNSQQKLFLIKAMHWTYWPKTLN